MHELPAVTKLVNCLEEEAASNGLKRISSVTLVIGELSSMEAECVRYYFELLSEGRSFEGATLLIEESPALLRCRDCSLEFKHAGSFNCPSCGGAGSLVKGSGREFMIKRIEGEQVESPEKAPVKKL